MGRKIIREDETVISMYAPGDGMLSFNRSFDGKSVPSPDDVTEAEARALIPEGWELFRDGPYWRAREIVKAPACPRCGTSHHLYFDYQARWDGSRYVVSEKDGAGECTECDAYFSDPSECGLPPLPDVVPADLASRAEAFIVGFEDDHEQEDVAELLADLRKALGMTVVGQPEYTCGGCGRPEGDCSAAPCADVIADREA